MKIVVREGEIRDGLDLCRLRRRVWLSSYVCLERGFTKERILGAYRFTDAQSVLTMRAELSGGEAGEVGVFVAEALLRGGLRKVVGFVAGERLENRLTMLYVDKICQGRGIGEMLWQRMKTFLDKRRDIVLTVVDFNENAQSFYARRGFVFDEEVGTPEGCESLFGARGMRRKAEQEQEGQKQEGQEVQDEEGQEVQDEEGQEVQDEEGQEVQDEEGQEVQDEEEN